MNEIGSWMALVEELKGIRKELELIRQHICTNEEKPADIDNMDDDYVKCKYCTYVDFSPCEEPCNDCICNDGSANRFIRKE